MDVRSHQVRILTYIRSHKSTDTVEIRSAYLAEFMAARICLGQPHFSRLLTYVSFGSSWEPADETLNLSRSHTGGRNYRESRVSAAPSASSKKASDLGDGTVSCTMTPSERRTKSLRRPHRVQAEGLGPRRDLIRQLEGGV
jgi:hypothetical protein